jgi:hypothetical protein
MKSKFPPLLVVCLLAHGTLLAADTAKPAEPAKPEAAKSKLPNYPRVNLSPVYEVVPNWPQRPAGTEAAAVPAISLDRTGNVWIYTRANPVVQVYAPDGQFVQSWREEDAGTVPHGLKFDADGNVWLVDCGLHVARKFSTDGKLLLTLGTLGELGNDEHHFRMPTDITFTPNGDIFVADGYGNSRVVRFDKTGKFIKAWGSLGTAPGQFSCTHAIGSDSKGRLYVADRNNVRIQIFDAEGTLLDTWQNVLVPWGFWISPKDEIWVCGSSPMPWVNDPKYPGAPLGCPPKDQLFMKFNPAGRVLEHWTIPKGADGAETPGDLNWVHVIALDAKGDIYAGDIIGKRVQKFARK